MIAEAIGLNNEELILNSELTSELRLFLLEKYPQIKSMKFNIAINQKIAHKHLLNENDEIALLPPYAGG